jgi:hypothetical protein
VLRGLVLTALVIFTPAALYGAYVAARGDTLQWESTHRLQVGWYLSLLISAIALIPFHGARKSFRQRPREWQNAMSRFQVVKEHDASSLASVVPIADDRDQADDLHAPNKNKSLKTSTWWGHRRLPDQKKMQVAFAETSKPQSQDLA